jgi:hypothetical protein
MKRLNLAKRPLALLTTLLLLLATLSLAVAQGQPATTVTVTGTYAGSVTVADPTALGTLDLVLNITDNGGTLTGQVNAAKTQVFLGGPTFTGTVTTNQVITPTLRIASPIFSGQVSGRTVQRQFTLVGEVLNNADTLRGEYTETITGFTPKPLHVKGKFILVRPAGSQVILAGPTATPTLTPTGGPGTPPTATPTATVTATPPGPGTALPNRLYLPLIAKDGGRP